MSGLPYYPRYPRDLFEGTAGMKLELKGPYSLLIDLIMMMGDRGLPDDPQWIAGQLGTSVRMWNKIRKCLLTGDGCPEGKPKITIENGIISNTRADKQKIIQRLYRDKQAENASGPNEINSLEQPPQTSNKEPDTKPYTDTGDTGARVSDDRFFEEVCEAAGLDLQKEISPYWHGGTAQSDMQRWRGLGLKPSEILDCIRAVAAKSGPPSRLSYFNGPLQDLAGAKGRTDLAPSEFQSTDVGRTVAQVRTQHARETYADENRRVLGGGPTSGPEDFLGQPNIIQIAGVR